MTTATNNTVNKTVIQNIVRNEINLAILNGNRITVSMIAKVIGMTPIRTRAVISEIYGEQVIFKRGRTGGIFFKEGNPPPMDTTDEVDEVEGDESEEDSL